MVTMPAQSPSLQEARAASAARSSVKASAMTMTTLGDDVDEEDRLPAVILGEIAADRRADRGREGHGQREQREPDRLLRLRQLGQHHGEGHRDQDAAGEALKAAQDDHRAEIMGEGAGDRERSGTGSRWRACSAGTRRPG